MVQALQEVLKVLELLVSLKLLELEVEAAVKLGLSQRTVAEHVHLVSDWDLCVA